MKVSIVIPVYNVEQYIVRALESVAAQTYRGAMECIIVDDASPDASMALAGEFIARYSGTIEFRTATHTENRGLSGARNTGVRHATGSHILFLDSDDELTPTAVESLVALAEKYSGVDIVHGNVAVETPAHSFCRLEQYGFPEYTADREWIATNMLSPIPVVAWGKLYRRELFTEHGLWYKEGIVHEDEHWRYMAFRHIRSIVFCLKEVYIYHLNSASITAAKEKDASFLSQLTIFNDYRPLIDRPGAYRFILLHTAEMAAQDHRFKNRNIFLMRLHQLWLAFSLDPHTPPAYRAAFGFAVRPTVSNFMKCMLRPTSARLVKNLTRMGLHHFTH